MKIITLLLVFLLSAYVDAEKQAKDIKHCQSVGQDYWYNGYNQIFCKHKDEK